jgi:hypothetical protein
MTNLEALQAMVEYTNANLFSKVLTDRGVTPSTAYTGTGAQQQALDLSLADIYLYLSQHPKVAEGSLSEEYTKEFLLAGRKTLHDKWGVALPEVSNAANKPTITGYPVQIGDTNYSPW